MILLRGFDNVMLDLAVGEPRLYELRDRLVQYHLDSLRQDVLTPADGVGFGDDWGTETGLMISPKLWRSFFRPAYAAMFGPVLAAGKHIHFHSDGYTWDILADLVDMGVSVLNVQHSVMDIRRLGRELGGKVAFRSDVDCQQVLQHGTRQKVYDHVKEIIECLGDHGGGLIGHGEIEPGMPLENVRWMLEAFHLFGRYS
jgi:uroporphyrinogen-III decarboxylase